MRSIGQGKTGASRFSLRDSIQENTGFAVLSRLKRFRGTKRLLGYILYGLKRLFGTKLCGQHQSGPENGVNNDVILHRFGRRDLPHYRARPHKQI